MGVRDVSQELQDTLCDKLASIHIARGILVKYNDMPARLRAITDRNGLSSELACFTCAWNDSLGWASRSFACARFQVGRSARRHRCPRRRRPRHFFSLFRARGPVECCLSPGRLTGSSPCVETAVRRAWIAGRFRGHVMRSAS
jgi:hypothetical protein